MADLLPGNPLPSGHAPPRSNPFDLSDLCRDVGLLLGLEDPSALQTTGVWIDGERLFLLHDEDLDDGAYLLIDVGGVAPGDDACSTLRVLMDVNLELSPELRYFGVPDGEGGMSLEAHESGRGVRTGSSLQNLSQGSFMATGNPLDVAVDGDGLLEVVMPNGQAAYTHGGSLHVDGNGRLVTATGAEVSPRIDVPAGTASMEITSDGTVVAIAEKEDEITVKVDDNVRLKMLKSSVARNLTNEEAAKTVKESKA